MEWRQLSPHRKITELRASYWTFASVTWECLEVWQSVVAGVVQGVRDSDAETHAFGDKICRISLEPSVINEFIFGSGGKEAWVQKMDSAMLFGSGSNESLTKIQVISSRITFHLQIPSRLPNKVHEVQWEESIEEGE